jgi:hypothetical protein
VEIKLQNLISVSEVSRSASATIAKAQAGEVQIILNHNKPLRPLSTSLCLKDFAFLKKKRNGANSEAIAEKRIREDNGVRHSLDDVAAKSGIKLPPRKS